jgi:hypothetical protein
MKKDAETRIKLNREDITKMENGYQSMFRLISEVDDLKASISTGVQSSPILDQLKGLDVPPEVLQPITTLIEEFAKSINNKIIDVEKKIKKLSDATSS